MKLCGALLVILSGAAAGFSAGGSVRRIVSLSGLAEQMLERFRNLVCLRRLSLPEAILSLHEEFPQIFPGRNELEAALPDIGFEAFWKDMLYRWSLPTELSAILLPLGRELSAGGDPERCLERVAGELRRFREENRARQNEALRLYPVLGITGGCLLAILFL